MTRNERIDRMADLFRERDEEAEMFSRLEDRRREADEYVAMAMTAKRDVDSLHWFKCAQHIYRETGCTETEQWIGRKIAIAEGRA